ncbi:MAG TPA: LuxR C-terminal-related transcriptional regulator [Ramlibacter sp.]
MSLTGETSRSDGGGGMGVITGRENAGKLDRHASVKQLAAQGLSTTAIAEQLGLSEGTVKDYKKKALVALGVPLSARERQIYDFAAQGLTSSAIAGLLGLVPQTVELHRHRAMKKLGVKTAAGLVALHKSKETEAILAELAELKVRLMNMEQQLAAVLKSKY